MSAIAPLSNKRQVPAWCWLALPAIALVPVWRWSAARLMDGSDDPLGVVALATLMLFLARDRDKFAAPRARWFALATVLAVAAVSNVVVLPALARGVLAVFAMCATLLAVREPNRPIVALAGLALLALPLLSSLQFFAGFPLRLVTAEASRLVLALFGIDAERSGTALAIGGHLVMVDAPCAGIHMAWAAYYAACAVGVWRRIPDVRFVSRLPVVGIAVLIGNIARNTVLVVKEAGLVSLPTWSHEAIGLVIFAGVCAFVVWHVGRGNRRIAPEPALSMYVSRSECPARLNRATLALSAVILVAVSAWSWLRSPIPVTPVDATAVEWPLALNGRTLQPLALSAVERRFADRFPGAIGRFSDGRGVIVLRRVIAPTRMLHPAADCYRGLGYRVRRPQLVRKSDARSASTTEVLWRCFVAEKDGRRLRVCERIVDADGQGFTDTSRWYWAAVTGRSRGPWRAITEARLL